VSFVAFALLAGMVSIYVILDGYDLGAAAVSPMLAKTRAERSTIVASFGPFWSGNEVWLVAAGGTLFALFPKAYAISFSGFYLPFIIVLWLLMFRGIAIELREHLPAAMWTDFWDVALSISSVLLMLLFGVALGNLLRGFPLNAFSSLLNPYAIAVGVLAVAALVQHGLAYVASQVTGPLAARARILIGRIWWLVIAAFVAVTVLTVIDRSGDLATAPIAIAASVSAFVALVAVGRFAMLRRTVATFRASVVFLAGMLVAASATMYPYLIRPYHSAVGGLTIAAAAPPASTLAVSLIVATAGLVAVICYSTFVRRQLTVQQRDGARKAA
jgi:cytochrome d ubiquinol oxidase subunit II